MADPIGQLGAGGLSVPAKQRQRDKNGLDAAVKRGADALAGTANQNTIGSFPVGVDTGHGTAKNPTIYMGSDSRIAYVGQDAAAGMYYKWDNKTKNQFLSQLSLVGYDTGQLKDAQLASLWAGYVKVAGKYSLAGKWVSPWEVIGKDIAQREREVAKPKTVTQTQKSYNLSTAEDAHALFQGAAQTLLGRDPTKAEIARFKGVLNKYEQANPTMTTTTSDYLGSELQNQESTTKGGVTAASQQLIATEEAKKDPEYGAYQAATNGMNWLMEMIGGG
ncbi:MAG TPA: hypothetical protein VIY48_05585 [Candidatus Paceibacterota bacterium]